MSQPDPKIKQLEDRLDRLVRTQIDFQSEVTYIRAELSRLRPDQTPAITNRLDSEPQPSRTAPINEPSENKWSTARSSDVRESSSSQPEPREQVNEPSFGHSHEPAREEQPSEEGDWLQAKISDYFSQYVENAHANLEKFIGENLISKIGIIILVLGVGIGAKYAIDNNLISPLARVVLGYIFGFGLLGMAVKLKPKYHDFSAILLSGGTAIMYFITYFAYSSYQLMPQPAAFILMVMFTIFTVVAAIVYDRQVIAHIGIVGAYAVPFLLSNNSGNYAFLFSYMAILNTGILAISIKKAWKPIFYNASAFTWLIFAGWFLTKYQPDHHFSLALVTLGVFFSIFYATKIVHGVVHPDAGDSENLISTIATAVIFYALAFRIEDGLKSYSGYVIYFSFLAFFALVILVSSYRFYGRILALVTYPFTWLIFASWFFKDYSSELHFGLATAFACIYFLIFYGATLVYRVVTEDIEMEESTGILLTNSFIFYGLGYGILDSRENLRQYEGLFTAGHGLLHSLTAQIVNRFRPNAVDVIQTLAILIITFSTIAIPVQFDGNTVTLIWSVEAAALFYFGRARLIWLFECLSYPVMLLAAGSMAFDWISVYSDRVILNTEVPRPFANGDMVTGLVFVAACGYIYFLNRKEPKETVLDTELILPFGYFVAGAGLFALYNTFRMEIGNYFHLLSVTLGGGGRIGNSDVSDFNAIAQINFTMLFLIVMALVNIRKVRSVIAGGVNVATSILLLAVTSTVGMYLLYELRESYQRDAEFELFGMSSMNIAVRYITYAFTAGTIITLYEYYRNDLLDPVSTLPWRSLAFDAVLYLCVLILASCELMNIAAHTNVLDADKFGLSILWGVFSLGVIVIGIAKAKKHLRIGAFVLLAVTLVKLFFYDATDLPTIPKTLLFVSIGLLMLGISFLYNKFRNVIFVSVGNEEEVEE